MKERNSKREVKPGTKDGSSGQHWENHTSVYTKLNNKHCYIADVRQPSYYRSNLSPLYLSTYESAQLQHEHNPKLIQLHQTCVEKTTGVTFMTWFAIIIKIITANTTYFLFHLCRKLKFLKLKVSFYKGKKRSSVFDHQYWICMRSITPCVLVISSH